MNRTQKINFNESLLIHSLSKSDANLSHRSSHRKSRSSLLSELNMTYSRLTLDTKYDCVKENLSTQIEFQLDLQNEDQLKIQEILPQKELCVNCKLMKQQLKTIQLFLLQFEKKIIKKELLLADKYKKITNQLAEKSSELIISQNFCKKLEQEIYLLKNIKEFPKINLNSNIKTSNEYNLSSETTKYCIDTLERTKVSENMKSRNKFNQSTQMSRYLQTDKQNNELAKKITELDSMKKSLASSVDFSYTDSERQYSPVIDPLKGKINEIKNLSFFSIKNRPNENNNLNKDYELSKLRFENSSLKSYNSVLLEHLKPRSLADKVFLMRLS